MTDTLAQGKIILVQSSRTGRYLKRHPNDLKLYQGEGRQEVLCRLLELWNR